MKTKIAFLLSVLLLLCVVTGQAFADSLMLPESLETIEEEAFYGDTSIDEVVLPDGVSAIGDLAFAYSGLQRITIPDTVTQIAENAFDGLEGLTIVSSANAPARDYAALRPQCTWEEQICIDETNFPDTALRTIAADCDTDNNGWLSRRETAEIHTLDLGDRNIGTLQGIESFTELKVLFCPGNQGIDLSAVSGMPLEVLVLNGCQLTNLDIITSLPELRELRVPGNNLSALDLSNNPELAILECHGNEALTELDIGSNPKLQALVKSAEPSTETFGDNGQKLVYTAEDRYLSINAGMGLTGIPYVVTYDANGGYLTRLSGGAVQGGYPEVFETVYVSGPDRHVALAAVRDGYTFTGWLLQNGTVIGLDDTFTVEGEMILTAQWEENGAEPADLPEIGFYSAETASEQTYLSPANVWEYSDQDRTLYLIARNGAVMTEVQGPFQDPAGSSGLNISLSPDGTVAAIQVGQLIFSQIVVRVSGTHSDGEAFEDEPYGISVANSSPALYWQRANTDSGEEGGAGSLSWSSYPYGYINVNSSMNSLGRFVYGVPENGEITDSMETVSFDQLEITGDPVATVTDHGGYLELNASGYGTGTLSYNGHSISIYNTLPINDYHFPDETFRNFLSRNVDTNADGFLSSSEIGQVSSMNLSGLGITDLSGIEIFTELTSLNCSDNPGISLGTISGLPLTELLCSGCELTYLNVTPFADLEILCCNENNDLDTLDLSRNPVLSRLMCQDTAITELDLSNNPMLAEAVRNAVPETQTSGSGRQFTVYRDQDKLLEIGAEVEIKGIAPHYDVVPTAVTIIGSSEPGKVEASFDELTMTTRVDLFSEIAGVEDDDYENLEYYWEESENLIDWFIVDNSFEESNTELQSCIRVEPGGTPKIIYIREVVNGVSSNILEVIFTAYGDRHIAVIYDSNGGYFRGNSTEYAEHVSGGYIQPLDLEATREGYTLIGWSTDPIGEAMEEIIAYQDIRLYAVWGENLPEYTVTYHCAGGAFTGGESTRTEKSVSPVYEIMREHPSRAGYRFSGWYLNEEKVSGKIPAAGDMTITAHWIQQVTLSYDANGGTFENNSNIYSVTMDMGATETLITYGPTKEGSAFAGWCDEGGNRITQVTLTGNLTVYASWTSECTVTLDAAGGLLSNGGMIMTVTVPYGTVYTPELPTREDFAFTGWKYNWETVTSVTVTSNITLTAEWEEIYSVQPNSVTIEADQYEVDTTIDMYMPYNPDFYYVTLSGTVEPAGSDWNYQWEESTERVYWAPLYGETSPSLTVEFTGSTNTYEFYRLKVNNSYSNVVEIKVYDNSQGPLLKVTLDANQGQFDGGADMMILTHYGYEDCLINEYVPTREGCLFAGWTMDGTSVGDSISSYEDVTLLAQWENQ